jgi:hypothetical protein
MKQYLSRNPPQKLPSSLFPTMAVLSFWDEDTKDAEELNSFVLFSSVSSLIGLCGSLECSTQNRSNFLGLEESTKIDEDFRGICHMIDL